MFSGKKQRHTVLFKTLFVVLPVVLAISLVSIDRTVETKESVTIYRDNYGVPHIYAQTVKGLFTAWGYSDAILNATLQCVLLP
jgi:acyl-homoserine lactone acylase PvdQ